MFSDLRSLAEISKHQFLLHYTLLVQELELNPPPVNLIDLTYSICLKFDLSFCIIKKIIRLLSQIKKHPHFISGKNPVGIVAGAIYNVAKKEGTNLTQKAIAEAVGLTTLTLRKRRKELNQYNIFFKNIDLL